MNINLEQAENAKVFELYDKAYDGLYDSSDVDYTIFTVLVSKIFSLIAVGYVFSSIHIGLLVFVLVTLIIEFILDLYKNTKLHEKDKEISSLSYKTNYITQTLTDYKIARDIFIYQSKDFFLNKYDNVKSEVLRLSKEKKKIGIRFDLISGIINFVRTCIIYIVAIIKYINGELPIANFLLFYNAVKQMAYAIWQILSSFSSIFKMCERFDDYVEYKKISESNRALGNCKVENKRPTFEFVNVSYRYPNQKFDAVKNISFKIEQGQTAAIVGNNGAGKSTIIKLILRLYKATEGDILLNGMSIYEYSYDDYIAYMSIVFQDYMLYSFTIKENILFDNEENEEELNTILKDIGLEEKINSLPMKLDTPYTKRLYEDGVEFSGGQEQKLVIARCLAKNANVLILDEPTSALDPLSEYDIYKRISTIKANAFTIFISHRLSTTRFSDKILVLDDGELVEEGSHEELMLKKGLYYKTFLMQTSFYKSTGVSE